MTTTMMANGPEIRPLLPQRMPMHDYSFPPSSINLGDSKKNYVFVDEHNRHKRLKVMRACEGCRRRKIKCDAATTNSWPCAACVRLKLQCVPPTVNYDRTTMHGAHPSGLEKVLDFDSSSGSGEDDYGSHGNRPLYELGDTGDHYNQNQVQYESYINTDAFHTPPYSDRTPSINEFAFDDFSIPMHGSDPAYQETPFKIQHSKSFPNLNSHLIWNGEHFSATEISNVLGHLKIDENGEAPYISQQKKTLAEAPALEEFEVNLPSVTFSSGSTVKIPPELMPSDEQCLAYFDTFFTHVHPYVPVISKPYFYEQWRTNRKSISPLILEAIFACAGRMSEDPTRGAQWLALASKHEDCFMDVPRLSTIQALLLLLKARESAPKRGYYYRSWTTIKTIISFAKDLDLHEHHSDHQNGLPCGSDSTECLIKSRIWHTIFVCEMMIGGPQGRFDMGVAVETVDSDLPKLMAGLDPSDYEISRQFTYFVRLVKVVRRLNDIYGRVKKQKDWGGDQQFVELNPKLQQCIDELPPDFQIALPEDGSAPWVPSHFIANVHTYYHLTTIMLRRPQLMHSNSFAADSSWKQHMDICYKSAKAMCRLQEGVLQTHGLQGLMCMQRGINFVIYAVLTCTMIHLVAVTSPDPELNCDAKDYFTRHMRILETCSSAWPMPEMQSQIDALREAFSADTSQSFQLRRNFPSVSPTGHLQPTPQPDIKFTSLSRQTSHEQNINLQYQSHPLTPPISAGFEEAAKDHQFKTPSITMLPSHHQTDAMPTLKRSVSQDQSNWNPSQLFDKWHTAFGTPTSTFADTSVPQPSPPMITPTSISSNDFTPFHGDAVPSQQQSNPQFGMNTTQIPSAIHTRSLSSVPSYDITSPSFVTSSMWRDTVASTFNSGGTKRGWDADPPYIAEPLSNKRVR